MNTNTMTEPVWSSVNAKTGKLREVFHTSSFCGHPRFSVVVDGKEVAKGPFQRLDRERIHKNAPAGATHLIGVFCFFPEDAAVFAGIVDGIKADLAIVEARKDEEAKVVVRAKMEAAGIGYDDAEAVMDRWGRDLGRAKERAWEAEEMSDFGLLTRIDNLK